MPSFCKQVGIDAGALCNLLEYTRDLWNDPNADYMLNRGNPLPRIKFFVNLDEELIRFYTYPGAQWAATMSYLTPADERARLVVDAVNAMRGLAVDGKLVKMNHAIGTKYSEHNHSIKPHSDRPQSIACGSFIVGLSFGDARDFVLSERTPQQQTEWLKKPANAKAAHEPYNNKTGRTEEVVTMTHGSAIILSTSTNSRWVHSVPPPQHECWTARFSLIFRDISSGYTPAELQKKVASAHESKVKRDAKKASADAENMKRSTKKAKLGGEMMADAALGA